MIEDLDPSWQRVEARHLIALRAIARTGSFRAAALDRGYSLSALSEQVAALERLVGQQLVDRPGGRRSVRITEAGERLLEHADAIGDRLAAARADLAALAVGRRSLRLGIFQSVAVHLLPTILGRIVNGPEGLAVDLVERADDAPLLALVERCDLDATFAVLPIEGPFATAHLLDDPYLVVVPAADALATRAAIAPAELRARPLIDYRELRPVHQARTRLPEGGRARTVARSDDNGTIHALVAAGIGIAILPALSVDQRDVRVRAIPLEPAPAPRTVVLAWHRDRPPRGIETLVAAAVDAVAAWRVSGPTATP
jgi:molybdate transport repressor ModE-like protein